MMEYRNRIVIPLLAALLLLQVWSPTAVAADSRTVILKVHVPFVGG